MLKKILSLLAVSLVTLGGCAKECPKSLPCPETGAGETASAPVVKDKIRITLNADGTVAKIEGSRGGNWEPKLKEQTTAPGSLGAKQTTIEVFEHDKSEEDVASGGMPLHSHGGGMNSPYGSHCHRWVVIGGVNTLVHC